MDESAVKIRRDQAVAHVLQDSLLLALFIDDLREREVELIPHDIKAFSELSDLVIRFDFDRRTKIALRHAGDGLGHVVDGNRDAARQDEAEYDRICRELSDRKNKEAAK